MEIVSSLEPDEAYSRTVEAFQFFKNGKLKIWFKRPHYAEQVAKLLLGNKAHEAGAQALP